MAKRKNARVRKTDTSKWSRPNPDTVKVTHINATIFVPSGKCPVTLEGQDREAVREWVIGITSKKPSAHTYLASVYKYWVRDFYESYSQEYKDIGILIDTIVTKPVTRISDIGD